MFKKIYPNDSLEKLLTEFYNNLEKLNHYLRLFLREKKKSQFAQIEKISIDHFVYLLRIYNLNNFDLEKEFTKLFKNGCYVCHKIPCECNYYE